MAIGGLTFQPGVPQNGDAPNRANAPGPRHQVPVQLISTRLPKVFGSRAIAPAELLQSPGGMGQFAARGNVVAQAIAQLVGLPSTMSQPVSALYQSPQPSAPQSASGYGDWIRRERNLPGSGRPGLPSFVQQQPAPWVAPVPSPYPTTTPQPPPTIPPPRVAAGSETGEGPHQGFPLPPPFVPPIFTVPKPPDSIEAIADRLFRPGRDLALLPEA